MISYVFALVAAITACHASGGGGGGGGSGFRVVRVGGAILKRLTSVSILTDKYEAESKGLKLQHKVFTSEHKNECIPLEMVTHP